MSVRYKHGNASEGLHQLIFELKKAKPQRELSNVLMMVLSMKWVHLIPIAGDGSKSVLMRRYNEFTVGYSTDSLQRNDPSYDNHAEVVQSGDGVLYFRENGKLLTVSEFAVKLIALATSIAEACTTPVES